MINFINKAKKNPSIYYPITAYPVIIQFLLVAINLSADVKALEPQFPVMSIFADVVAVLFVRFVKISTSASFESWQF